MAETSLHPPDEVYGEYPMPKGLDESKDGTETPFRPTPIVEFMELELLAELVDVGAGGLGEVVGSLPHTNDVEVDQVDTVDQVTCRAWRASGSGNAATESASGDRR
jgi:hypothetical protein